MPVTHRQRPFLERAIRAGSRKFFETHEVPDPRLDVEGPRTEVGKCFNGPVHLFVAARSTARILKRVHIQMILGMGLWTRLIALHINKAIQSDNVCDGHLRDQLMWRSAIML